MGYDDLRPGAVCGQTPDGPCCAGWHPPGTDEVVVRRCQMSWWSGRHKVNDQQRADFLSTPLVVKPAPRERRTFEGDLPGFAAARRIHPISGSVARSISERKRTPSP